MKSFGKMVNCWNGQSIPGNYQHYCGTMLKGCLFLFSVLASVMMLHARDIQGFANSQLQAYPKTRLPGLCKSCFQDFMVAEHLASDHQTVRVLYLDFMNVLQKNTKHEIGNLNK